jgi:hypothetical protein
VKTEKLAYPKARLGANKPIDEQYAEVLRLRKIIAEIQSVKATQNDFEDNKQVRISLSPRNTTRGG